MTNEITAHLPNVITSDKVIEGNVYVSNNEGQWKVIGYVNKDDGIDVTFEVDDETFDKLKLDISDLSLGPITVGTIGPVGPTGSKHEATYHGLTGPPASSKYSAGTHDSGGAFDFADLEPLEFFPINVKLEKFYAPDKNQHRYLVKLIIGNEHKKLAVTVNDEVFVHSDAHIDDINFEIYKELEVAVAKLGQEMKLAAHNLYKLKKTFENVVQPQLFGKNIGGLITPNSFPEGFIAVGAVGPDYPATTSGFSIRGEAQKLPGVDTYVKYPCTCTDHKISKDKLFTIIMHLNDHHGPHAKVTDMWTRDRIADWIDVLHDDGIINAEFEEWDDEEKALKDLSKQLGEINANS